MWNPSKEAIASIIERCVRGSEDPYEWDDFLSSPISSPFLQRIQEVCGRIDVRFPPDNPRMLTSKEGKAFLLALASALRERGESEVLKLIGEI